jgi:hypothetical protein
MKCVEGTQTEEGSKWLKKKKRRSEVKEKKTIKREDQGRQINKEDESWTGQQVEEDTNRCFGAPRWRRRKNRSVKSLKCGLWGPRVLATWTSV